MAHLHPGGHIILDAADDSLSDLQARDNLGLVLRKGHGAGHGVTVVGSHQTVDDLQVGVLDRIRNQLGRNRKYQL